MFVAEYVTSAELQIGEVTVADGIMNIKCNANPSTHFCHTFKLIGCQTDTVYQPITVK